MSIIAYNWSVFEEGVYNESGIIGIIVVDKEVGVVCECGDIK